MKSITWDTAAHIVASRRRLAILAVIFVLGVGVAARADPFSDDLRARRAHAMEKLGPTAMAIFWSAPSQRYSRDVDYEYRQDSNLYYLTGITQENTILVMMPGNTAHREILFTKDRDPVQEHWHGRVLSAEEARARSGIDLVLASSQFETFVTSMLSRTENGGVSRRDAGAFFTALSKGDAVVALPLDQPRAVDNPLTPAQTFAQKIRDRFTGFRILDATSLLDDLRIVKTSYERKVLIASLDISNEAQMAGMHAAHPGAHEYEVKAAIEAVHRARGAASWAYPSIVGSGPNATILHYPDGEREMKAGELLLVDAACNYGYMSGDITRTYPVSGTFSPAQKEVYRLVLEAQAAGMRAAKPGASLQDIHKQTVETMKAGLLKLGLITDTKGDQYRLWFTHLTGHYIGIDVHDVGDTSRPLEPGMSFTIEPGLYIRESALDTLPRTPENLTLIEKIQPAMRKYADIGVRIEDSFLLEEGGLRTLSGAVPKTIEDIEGFLRARGATSSARQ